MLCEDCTIYCTLASIFFWTLSSHWQQLFIMQSCFMFNVTEPTNQPTNLSVRHWQNIPWWQSPISPRISLASCKIKRTKIGKSTALRKSEARPWASLDTGISVDRLPDSPKRTGWTLLHWDGNRRKREMWRMIHFAIRFILGRETMRRIGKRRCTVSWGKATMSSAPLLSRPKQKTCLTRKPLPMQNKTRCLSM